MSDFGVIVRNLTFDELIDLFLESRALDSAMPIGSKTKELISKVDYRLSNMDKTRLLYAELHAFMGQILCHILLSPDKVLVDKAKARLGDLKRLQGF